MAQSTAQQKGISETDEKRRPAGTRAAGVSFFCPAYLDEDNVARVAARGVSALARHFESFEWIIVEDHSPDGTGLAADKAAGKNGHISVVHNEKNLGHGGSLKEGFRAAKYEWAGYCDGDDQYDPRDLSEFVACMPHADVIIGRRKRYPNGIFRQAVSWSMNCLIRHMFGVPYRDLGCSFKMFHTDALRLCEASSTGIFVQCEMVLRAHAARLRVVEVEVGAYPRTSGSSSTLTPMNVARLCIDMLKLWGELNFGGGAHNI